MVFVKIFNIFILILLMSGPSSSEKIFSEDTVPLTIAGKTLYVHTNLPKDARLTTTELVRKSGHDCEEFDVVTEDNYILNLIHVLNDNVTQDLPIILLHGFMDSSDTFCVRREYSPAVHLTESGYDVWLGNMRGNRYSRRHVTLDPDVDKEYWDFSFHEQGYYDYAALIDEVLNKTGKSQLILIGHSQGTLNFFVLGSTRPEYNSKIKVAFALGPIFYSQHDRGLGAFLPIAFKALGTLTAIGEVEFLNQNSTIRRFIQDFCTVFKEVSHNICLHGVVFPLLGDDAEQIEPEFVPNIVGQYFAGTATKVFTHAGQLTINHHYGQFDYGLIGNLKKYKSPTAPLYNLNKISTKVILMVGKNDFVATVRDSTMLRDALPNVVYYELPREKFSHIDFVWGSQMDKYFYPYLHELLNKYK